MKSLCNHSIIIAVLLAFEGADPTRCSGAEADLSESPSAFRRFLESDYLLGDWGGLRTQLKEKGVDFEFLYFSAVPSNLEGGIKRGSVYEGGLMVLLDLYSEPLAGYAGGQFHAGALSIHNGEEFSANFVGDLNKVSMLDFPDTFQLWELWYEHKFLNDKLSLKAGQLAIDRDFIVPEYYNSLAGISFLNQTFFYPTVAFNVYDQPYFPVGYHGLASTPYGTPGVRLRADPASCLYLQVGVYDGHPDRAESGLRINLNDQEGALIYAEAGLKINQAERSDGPPGNLKIGGYFHSDDFYDMYQGTFAAFENYVGLAGALLGGSAKTYKGNYGFYVLADQTVWRETAKEDPARQGLAGFVRAAFAPEDRNLASWGVDGGLVYRGLIPKRDWDSFGIAASYLNISDDLSRAQQDINTLLPLFGFPKAFSRAADYEAVLEINYRAQLTAWWTLQTSVQRVFHPGGRVLQDYPNAWALIVQSGLRF